MIPKTNGFYSGLYSPFLSMPYRNVGLYFTMAQLVVHFQANNLSFISSIYKLKKLAHTSNTLEVYNYKNQARSSSGLQELRWLLLLQVPRATEILSSIH